MLGLKGPSYAVVSACTTGLHSIGDAARLIEYGDADVMLAGGAESTVSPLGIGGFAAMRARTGRAQCRERACQYVYISGVSVSLKKKIGMRPRRQTTNHTK